MKQYYKSLLPFIIFLVIFQYVVIRAVDLRRPCHHDECHFVETINLFGKEMNLNTIIHYNEMSTPLPFVLYALWGRIFGFELYVLRILSIIIAFATYIIFHKLLFDIFSNSLTPFLIAAFFAVNPYFVGFSVFVYTDMLGIFFMLICCISMIRQKPIMFTISSAAMLLCRQHYIFFFAASFVYYLAKLATVRKMSSFYMLLSCIISLLPMLTLFIAWGGLVPDNSVRTLYMSEGLFFHPNYLTLYVGQFFVYLLPFVIFKWRSLYKDLRVTIGCFIFSWTYWLFPVAVSKCSRLNTVGIFHRYLEMISNNWFFVQVVFFIAFFLGLPVVFNVLRDCYHKWRHGNVDFKFFLNLSILIFLVIMPFSYLVWEKYFLQLAPLVAIRILLLRYPDEFIEAKRLHDCRPKLY